MFKRTSLLAAFIAFAVAIGTASAVDFHIDADVVYGHKAGMALTYDVIQNQDNPNGAAVMFMMSGGWFSGWLPPERFTAAQAPDGYKHFRELLDKGYTLVIVRHGSAPHFKVPDAVADVRRAVGHFKQAADRWKVDPARIGVTGSSAGGHLSLMLGTDAKEGRPNAVDKSRRAGTRVAAVVAYFPPVDLRETVGPSKSFPALDFDKDRAESVSPLLFVTSDDAPTLLIHGDKDRLVPLDNSERIHTAFEKAKVDSELIVIEGARHGFRGADGRQASTALVNWFDQHLCNKESQTKNVKSQTAKAAPESPAAQEDDLWRAIARDDVQTIKRIGAEGTDLNQKQVDTGATPLIIAAVYGNNATAKELIERKAKLDMQDNQGSTALHVGAFFAHPEMVEILMRQGAEINLLNKYNMTPLDVVSTPWTDDLERLYKFMAGALNMEIDLDRIKSTRPQIAKLLQAGGGKHSHELSPAVDQEE